MFLILGIFGTVWIFILAKKVNQRPFVWALAALLSVIVVQFIFSFIGAIVFLLNYGITTPEDVTQKFNELAEANSFAINIAGTLISAIPIWMIARKLLPRDSDRNQDLQ